MVLSWARVAFPDQGVGGRVHPVGPRVGQTEKVEKAGTTVEERAVNLVMVIPAVAPVEEVVPAALVAVGALAEVVEVREEAPVVDADDVW
ncbi:hypothetical protein DAMNIGENAA_32580 [Desulforhabdus amnigena]|uniref:Uncharacterized protein n=1 Tax=Desulforhabdus amnigena TaxID=40218 RepID=A0A9W6FVP9_9BACT|nr:hypothetical protein DAMNIGENAA_32580 [Desulforhabdus amnigena]